MLKTKLKTKTLTAYFSGVFVLPGTALSTSFVISPCHALRDLEWDICLVCIGDLIIFWALLEDHLFHLEQVVKRLRDANLRLKPRKCHFVKFEVEYLGHVVSTDGLKPNLAKIRAVQEFPVPTNVTGVKAFLGLSSRGSVG